MTIEALEPHGFCAGVTNALRKAQTLLHPKETVYCLHELVHNELVVADLRAKGMVFVESLAEVPEGATVLFSAHGVSPAVRAEAEARHLMVVDATAEPIVLESGSPQHLAALSRTRPLGVVSQTTMNADDVEDLVGKLRESYEVESVAEVCRATKERQDAVKAFDGDALLVLGSANSSNTRRLCEVARCRTFRAGTLEDVRQLDFTGVKRLGVTSGASTPEDFFHAVIRELEGK